MELDSRGGLDTLQGCTASCSSAKGSCSSARCFIHDDASYSRRSKQPRTSSNKDSPSFSSVCSSSCCESSNGVQPRGKVETRCSVESSAAATERTMQVLHTTAAPGCRNGHAPVSRRLAGDAAAAQPSPTNGLSIGGAKSGDAAGAAVVSAAPSTPRSFFIRLSSSSMRSESSSSSSSSKENTRRNGGLAGGKRSAQGKCSAAHKIQRKPAGLAAKATAAAPAADLADDPAAAEAAAEEERRLLATAASAEATRPLPRRLVAKCISHENHEPWKTSVSGRLGEADFDAEGLAFYGDNLHSVQYSESRHRVAFYKEAIVWQRPSSTQDMCGAQEGQQQRSGGLSQVAGLRVLEVGCGPLALLSLLALQQGASQVDALEVGFRKGCRIHGAAAARANSRRRRGTRVPITRLYLPPPSVVLIATAKSKRQLLLYEVLFVLLQLNPTVHQFASTFTHQIGIGAAVSHQGVPREKQSQQQQRLRIFRCYSKLFPLSPKPAVDFLTAAKCAEADSPAPRAVVVVRHDPSLEAAPQSASFEETAGDAVAAQRTPDDAQAARAKVEGCAGSKSGFDGREERGLTESASKASIEVVNDAANKAVLPSADAASPQPSATCFSAPPSSTSPDAAPTEAQLDLSKSLSLPAATDIPCVESSEVASLNAKAKAVGEVSDADSAPPAADCLAAKVEDYSAAGKSASATRAAAPAAAASVSLSDRSLVRSAAATPLHAFPAPPAGTSDSPAVRAAVRSLKHWRKGPSCLYSRRGTAVGHRSQRQCTSQSNTILKSFCTQASRLVHRSSRDLRTSSRGAQPGNSQQQRQQHFHRKQQYRGCCYDLILHEILGDFASQEGAADVIRDIQSRTNSIPKSIPFAARTFIGISELPSPCCIKYPVGTPVASNNE
ncbi:hypothetical protein Emed_003825 [Eimeria media]